MSTGLLTSVQARPDSEQTKAAYLVLKYAHDTAKSFLTSFEYVRKSRAAKGTATDEEQDLLRAMLIFASAGLDSMLKQLIKDALPSVIERNDGARMQFKNYVEKKILNQKASPTVTNIDAKLLSGLLIEDSPKEALIEKLLYDLTSDSIQSKDQLLRVASSFGISTEDLSVDLKKLKTVFEVRNQIAHEMDIDFKQPNRNRVPRAKNDMIEMTNIILKTADHFLNKVDEIVRLSPRLISFGNQ